MQVRKRPLNKKEISKKEEDIITIELGSNALTVHETKLKVSAWWANSLTAIVKSSTSNVLCFHACMHSCVFGCDWASEYLPEKSL